METIPKIPQTLVCGIFLSAVRRAFRKKRCQRIKILHLLILPKAQKVNAPGREKEKTGKKAFAAPIG